MLSGKVAVVTGATRGIGKGIALQLGEAGATVYITGRTLQPTGKGTSLMECAEEIEKRGGKCIPVQCDHEKDDNIKALFDRIEREQNGHLDILVNNAYKAVTCDRMAADCAHELRKHNVAFISLWPGAVKTEFVADLLTKSPESKSAKVFAHTETVEFSGKTIAHLAADPNIMQKSGRTLFTCLLAEEYGFTDIDGQVPVNFRTVKDLLTMRGHTWLAAWTPAFLKIPGWLLAATTHKF
uniref:Dehydrogenase/reductase SDR family member 1 n=1 Tax=Branchiostoma floridae TaxID=7739 RepID=C3ZBR8_BRAFL|eukprot:XP_002594294.1 hypothetical protein BRAFLDRAFT_117668 [Branchiostoma floridae]